MFTVVKLVNHRLQHVKLVILQLLDKKFQIIVNVNNIIMMMVVISIVKSVIILVKLVQMGYHAIPVIFLNLGSIILLQINVLVK